MDGLGGVCVSMARRYRAEGGFQEVLGRCARNGAQARSLGEDLRTDVDVGGMGACCA